MKIKKINEIIDTNGELIGANDVPTSGPNLESGANNTTDYNMKIGTQPYRYDFMGRMGMTMLPFNENDESNEIDNNSLVLDIAKLMYEKYMETLKYYYQNPNKLKSDYRVKSEETFENQPDNFKKMDIKLAKRVLKVVDEKLSNSENKTSIDEGKVVEDKMMDKKSEDEISKKSNDSGITDKKLVKIAGLLNKMPEKDVDKLITLLERIKY